MTKETIPNVGEHQKLLDSAKGIFSELQGLKISVIAPAAAAATTALAAIRDEDTVIGAFEIVPGTVGDTTTVVSRTATISSIKASGTLAWATHIPVADGTFAVNGLTYTWKASGNGYSTISIATTTALCAAAAAAAINAREGQHRQEGPTVSASANSYTVTVTAKSTDPAVGNAVTLVCAGDIHAARSGATLAGGTDTGSVAFSATTAGSVLLVWLDKNA